MRRALRAEADPEDWRLLVACWKANAADQESRDRDGFPIPAGGGTYVRGEPMPAWRIALDDITMTETFAASIAMPERLACRLVSQTVPRRGWQWLTTPCHPASVTLSPPG
jgi:hypothetical protein